MPNRPKPTALKLIDGNPGRRPISKDEVKPRQSPRIPAPPAYLGKVAANEWRRVAPELHILGVLTSIDKATLAAYCQAFERWRAAEDALERMKQRDLVTAALMVKTSNGNAIQNPLVGTANRAMVLMARFAIEFGMTPAARAGLETSPLEDDQEHDKTRRYF